MRRPTVEVVQGQHRDDDPALAARAAGAWALLLGVRELRSGQVLVQPRSNLCGPGRVGILRLGASVTAVAPTEAAASVVERHINDVALAQTTDAAVVGARLNVMEVVGPAYLSYASAVEPVATSPTQVVSRSDLHTFLGEVPAADLDESGFDQVTSPVSVVCAADGGIAAASGWREWPSGMAHLAVLTRPDCRREGLARAVAADASRRALENGLLPQWRARFAESRAVARSLGFVEIGAQLNFQLLLD